MPPPAKTVTPQSTLPMRQTPPSAKPKGFAAGAKLSAVERLAPISFDDQGLKMLVYGRSGSGKTTFTGTFPTPIMWMICSGGIRPGELRSLNTPEMRDKVRQVVLQESGELRELTNYARDTGQFKTIVLDHATGLLDLILKEILGIAEIPVQKHWGFAAQGDYATAANQGKELIRGMLNLTGNVVIIAQEKVYGTENDQVSEVLSPTVGAEATPSVVRWLNPAVDYVVQTFLRPKIVTTSKVMGTGKQAKTITQTKKDGVEYCLRTAPDETYITKFRVPKGTPLPPALVDPNFEQVMALINGEYQGDSE